jgi:TRAP-type C4-dicarboxylate transport system permease small subunit
MRALINLTWKLIDITALIAFAVMLALVMSQVVFRYLIQVSVPWTEEAARWFYAWQIFLGSSLAMRDRLHLQITVLLDRFSGRPRALLDLLTALTGLGFLIGIIWGSFLMIRAVYPVQAGSFPVSTSYLYLSIPVGLIAMLALAAWGAIDSARRLFQPRAGEERES